jgi:transcriptional regulator with AAA-type ATPase domain
MIDSEHTITSPLSVASRSEAPLLAMTIAWHPDQARIGEQFIWADRNKALELSRFVPLFRKPGDEGLGLGHSGISRAPLRMVPDRDGVTIHSSDSRMVTSLNGFEIGHPARLTREQVSTGAILSLGRAVLLCLHWVRCLPKHNPVDGWLGVGSAAIKTRDLIRQVARTDATVLLLGETGTGKDVAARAIHGLSRRAEAPMVSVNMAALNESLAAADLFGATKGAYTGAQVSREGLFGQAQGATLFLDEVGNTPAAVQPMLLRVLETGEYRRVGASTDSHSDARLIAATDQNLYGGGFNQALLRRLESFIIQIPPLRARREDIGVLIVHMLQSSPLAGGEVQLPVSLVAQLLAYDWPGNVRQLAHVVKRALLALHAGETPDFDTLADSQREAVPAPASPARGAAPPARAPARARLHELGEEDVLAAMEQSAWYIQGAAQVLGISRPSMYKLLAAHSQIRSAERIPADEIVRAFASCGGDLEDCASLLKTPTEGLRRELRVLNLARDPAAPAPAFPH